MLVCSKTQLVNVLTRMAKMEINYNLVNVGLTLSSSAVLSSKNHFKILAIVSPSPYWCLSIHCVNESI